MLTRDSNGVHCPFYRDCAQRKVGSWCLDRYLPQVKHLLDLSRLTQQSYNFVHCGKCKISEIVEDMASYYLESWGIREPPVPMELMRSITNQYHVEIRSVRLNSCHGAVWYLDRACIVHINAREPIDRNRFALFHEAFHILVHYHASSMFGQNRGSNSTFREILADGFAGSILAPDNWIKEKWLKIHDPNKLATIFQVPKSVIYFRLKRQGLI